MNRSTVATHLGLALLAFGALVLASLTLGFASVATERDANVSVVSNDQAYLNTSINESVNVSTGSEFVLANVTNQFNKSININASIDDSGKNIDMSDIKVEDLEPGNSSKIKPSCGGGQSNDTYTVIITSKAEAENQSAAIKKEGVRIECYSQ